MNKLHESLKNFLNEDKYKNDTKAYIEDVLNKMSRRQLEREHGEYYSSTNLRSSSDRVLKIDIIAGKYGRREAQHWSRYVEFTSESVNEAHDMHHPIEMENNRMMRSSAAEFTRYLTRKAHESRPENFIENGIQSISEKMPIKEKISNLPLNENPNRVYGMFTSDQGKPTKLDKELLDIALYGLPHKIVKNIDAVEANGYGKQNAISPHPATKKGVGTGSVAYHMIHIGLLKPMGPKKVTAITLGLRKRTSGPGTGYIYMKVAPDWSHNYGPDAEAATEFWMDNDHASEKIKELVDTKFKNYLG